MKFKFASLLLLIVFCSIIITGTSGFIGASNVNIATKPTPTPSEHPKLALIGDPIGGGGLPCGGNKTC
jgi:hypothetical protein